MVLKFSRFEDLMDFLSKLSSFEYLGIEYMVGKYDA